ncbi:hypothetical protein HHS_07760 [Candidatus Pantoea carbekii]|uniref:Octanoyltransferase n=1 Tax=Candidatus Pantoea carbekii TaxID=1235990 RepID=U3U3K1_9GAMM|nr:hypothetical protein HHS_07760 [Candidatus Pantoea carbekii]
MLHQKLIVRQLNKVEWSLVSHAMHQFTDWRNKTTKDEVWLVEHDPIFTQGQAGKMEHVLKLGNIPVLQSDRGGQITYHGPGQQLMYVLIDLRRRKMAIHELIAALENTIVATLKDYGIIANKKTNSPGVYVGKDKICSLGLRVRKGCSLHGLAFNISMDLSPFKFINPCGYAGMHMVQLSEFRSDITLPDVQSKLLHHFSKLTGFNQITWSKETVF